jgi:hypothetical protein
MSSDVRLPPYLDGLYAAFQPGVDVPISELLSIMGFASRDPRTDQQYVGAYLTKLNRRIRDRKQRIVPGDLKRTYRLVTL